MSSNPRIYLIERIISSASYLTLGFAGFVWLILAALLKKRVTDFIMYHIMLSIILSMIYFVIVMILNFPPLQFLYAFIYKIPLINLIPYYINMPLSLCLGMSILQLVKISVILYLAISSFCGVYTFVPYISDIVRGRTGR